MTGDKPLVNEGPLALYGEKLVDNGYNIVPIMVGEKRPKHGNWTKIIATKRIVREWKDNGHLKSGVGIITKNAPGVDIDVGDDKVVDQLVEIAREIFGAAPLRIGRRPRVMLIYRTDEPFKKLRSKKYIDDMFDDTHQVEILCDGQQFVAYHIHPDTKRPYLWPADDGPLHTPYDDLTVITVEQCEEFIRRFEEIADAREDWKVAQNSAPSRRSTDGKVDDVWSNDGRKVDLTMEELKERLMMIPCDMEYQDWCNVGMALYHHSDGDAFGLEIWHEWSQEGDNYDANVLDEKWPTFSMSDKPGMAPITATFIMARSKIATEQLAAKLLLDLKDQFTNAREMSEWTAAKIATSQAEIDTIQRSQLVDLAKRKLDQITATNTPISEVRKALAYSPKGGKNRPHWLEPWVYDTSQDRFFHTEDKIAVTKQGFDAMFDRNALTKKDIVEGKDQATRSASELALQIFPVEVVQGRRYEPGQDPIFHDHGKFANTYAENEIPDMPEKMTPRDKRNVERVKQHIRHLLVDPDERHVLLDWLSWVVQNPGSHVNWAILLQGTEGDGKSWFGELMREVMGQSNVRMLNATSLESSFTDWSVGQCLTCIEEVRLINPNNKYEVLNKIKPYITNKVIEIHPKGAAQYNARNTTSYLMFSNFRDALPLGENGRRYCILFSRFQTKAQLEAFRVLNPDYYEELYAAILQSPGALRKWLLNREQRESFKPFGDAPDTAARKFMIREAQPEMIQALDDAIRENVDPLITENLLDLEAYKHEMGNRGVEVFKGKGLSAALARHDYEFLGRVEVDGEKHVVYSKIPENWRYIGSGDQVYVDFEKIRTHIRKHKTGDPLSEPVDDDEL